MRDEAHASLVYPVLQALGNATSGTPDNPAMASHLELTHRTFGQLLSISPTPTLTPLWYGDAVPSVKADGLILSDFGPSKPDGIWLGLRYLLTALVDDVLVRYWPNGWEHWRLEKPLFETSSMFDLFWVQANLGRGRHPDVLTTVRLCVYFGWRGGLTNTHELLEHLHALGIKS